MSEESTSNTVNVNVKKMAADYETLVKTRSMQINKPLSKYIEMPITENKYDNMNNDMDIKTINIMLNDIISSIIDLNHK